MSKDIFSGSIKVNPADKGLIGETNVPGDKSISHRSIIFGSIAKGTTTIDGFLEGEDNLSTIGAFEAMGVDIKRPAIGQVVIKGVGTDGLKEPNDVLNAGNSGTTARLITGLLSAQPFFSVLTGDASLRTRPMGRVVEPLKKMGARISGRGSGRLLPISIDGTRLTGINYDTPIASAQLKSSLLLAGLYADGETIVVEPEKSRDHTERMLKAFGADISVEGNAVRVRPGRLLSGQKISVPGDISSAAFLMCAGAIVPGSQISIRGVGVNPTRTGILNIIKKMGGNVEVTNVRETGTEPIADIVVRHSTLIGVDIDGALLLPAIDEFPAICVLAAFADGPTTISGATELRVKESDRVMAMAQSLCEVGAVASEMPDGIRIEGTNGGRLRGGSIKSRGDHRVAMSMAICALMTEDGVDIEGSASVDVSFPGFFDTLNRLKG